MSAFRVPHLGRPVHGTVNVPGSKSLSNRALVTAALAEGDSTLVGVAPGDDTAAMLDGLDRLGVRVERSGHDVLVQGTGGRLTAEPVRLDAALAGTTSRFLTALACLARAPVTIDGDPPLRRRPMGVLHTALTELGATITAHEGAGSLPVTVRGPLRSGTVRLRGDVSSQYLTALMLIAPLLPDGLELEIDGPLVSRPYVTLTAAVMEAFGITGVRVDEQQVSVPAGAYLPAIYRIEPDASSASYPLALAAACGGEITVPGLGAGALQGDAAFADLLGLMGCEIERGAESITVRRDPDIGLVGLDVDMADISDLVPTVAVVATLATTPSRIRGVGFIRAKESDRLGDLAHELTRTGARVEVGADGLAIHPAPLHGARLGTHHDHRLAMAFGVLGAAVEGIELDDPDVVTKSWPAFWDDLAAGVR